MAPTLQTKIKDQSTLVTASAFRPSLSHKYALTIKNTKMYNNRKDKRNGIKVTDKSNRLLYLDVIDSLEKKGWSIDKVIYETTTKHGKPCPLHIHCRASHIHKPFPYPTYPGVHLWFKDEYDSKGWASYCLKEQIRNNQHNTIVKFNEKCRFSPIK